jgi:pyruvate/2-oxoglutarate dehydrogenase complex dihydrolipoamide dehydrogenase (E3) component
LPPKDFHSVFFGPERRCFYDGSMATEHFKNLIIGSGEAGKLLAWHLAAAGEPTAVVERRWIGGSCPNINCLPSKNEIASARVAYLVYHAGEYGTRIGSASIDMGTVRKRKRDMVHGQVESHLQRYRSSGAELILGEAAFIGERTVRVRMTDGGERTLSADRVFLNLGTHPSIPATPGLAESGPMTNIEALELDRLPEHLIVIGGGYVGLEFAQAYRRFGSRVTIIQHASRLLVKEDPDVSEEITRILEEEGIQVLFSAEIDRVTGRSGADVSLLVRTPIGEDTLQGSDILVAVGRTPNTAGIGLETAGVQLDRKGYVRVNDRLETTAPGIWALGECAGSPQYTHVSHDDFRIIRDNLAGGRRSARGRLIPYCLFTDPQLAHVGLTESDARRLHIEAEVVKMPTSKVLRTFTTGEQKGFMKVLIDPSDDRILGFTMIGSEAGEVMAVVQTAMLAELPYTTLRDAILTHPTMAEGLNALFDQVPSAVRR